MENSIQIHGFANSSIHSFQARGIAKCFEAYAEYCPQSEIMEVGYNINSGYTYIALEYDPITICSLSGRDVEYLVTDFDNGDEHFFPTYEEAMKFDNTI